MLLSLNSVLTCYVKLTPQNVTTYTERVEFLFTTDSGRHVYFNITKEVWKTLYCDTRLNVYIYIYIYILLLKDFSLSVLTFESRVFIEN